MLATDVTVTIKTDTPSPALTFTVANNDEP